jgi:thioredoxin-related protein
MKILITSILLIIAIFTTTNTNAQKVKWYTFSEAIELNKKEPRKIFIDVYTEWCGWCKVMDDQTFQNPTIVKILNEKYYAVKFDAERKDDVEFQGHTFKVTTKGKRPPHELAIAMLKGKMTYPNIVFMNEESQFITSVPGFQKPEQIEPLLIYMYNSLYEKNVNYQDYVKNYYKNETK